MGGGRQLRPQPTAQSFRVYLRWVDDAKRGGKQLTPEAAQQYGFFINWIGVDQP
ncbi:hypothetical protein [Streptomyces sp. 13-12-16]|uniref:hypothetical protein n=1 Tax=Streptomyces sp. 13-12-16 TaxID=1570823 RepID=UPI0015C4C832|nr:hypothetical protein [Streptomyces sp. 13-12-16]